MKRYLLPLALLAQPVVAETFDPALLAPIEAYEAAVNNGDLDGIIAQFTADPVLMAQNYPPAVGLAAVTATYAGIVSTLDLAIDFTFEEAFVTGPDYAVVRTQSGGELTIKGETPVTIPNANQEMFLLQRVDGKWKIARYIFATTLAQ